MTQNTTQKLITILSIFILHNNYAFAHVTPPNGSGTSGPILTASPQTLKEKTFAVTLSYEHFQFDSFSDSFLEDVAADGFEEVHNTDAIEIPSIAIAYGVTDRFELSLLIPFVLRTGVAEGELEEDGEAEVEFLGSSSGIGDITVFGKYQLLQEESSEINAALSFGLKIPSGETNKLENDESVFEAEFQPGSGSFDYIFGASIGKGFNNWRINSELQFILATEGTQESPLASKKTKGL